MKHFQYIAMGALALTACAPDTPAQMILPGSLKLPTIADSQIISECDYDGILEPVGNEITCVSIPFPDPLANADDKEIIGVKLSRQYADVIITQGWTAVTEWPLVYNFEKPISDDCSATLQLLAWLVDEKKAPEDRLFETSRISFIANEDRVCGDKRKAK